MKMKIIVSCSSKAAADLLNSDWISIYNIWIWKRLHIFESQWQPSLFCYLELQCNNLNQQRVHVLTWISERPGSIHIAYVCCDAACQDAVQQGDKATVPLGAPRPVNVTQDEVERDPAAQGQERTNHQQSHLLFYRPKTNKKKLLKPTHSFSQTLASQ